MGIRKIVFNGNFTFGNCRITCKNKDILSYDDKKDEVYLNGEVIPCKRDFMVIESMIEKGCCGYAAGLFDYAKEEDEKKKLVKRVKKYIKKSKKKEEPKEEIEDLNIEIKEDLDKEGGE